MKEKKVYNVEQEANEEKIDFQEVHKQSLALVCWYSCCLFARGMVVFAYGYSGI